MKSLNRPTLERLLLYYHFIDHHLVAEDGSTVSSTKIANFMDLDDTQVRKDLAAISLRGRPRVGFVISEVKSRIRNILGFEEDCRAVVVGAGRLGGAIASYSEFRIYGLDIVALFDNHPDKIGRTIGNHVVQPVSQLLTIVKQRKVRLGVITVPAEAAQDVAEKLVQSEIKALWNFSPKNLIVPKTVTVRDEHLSVGLADLLYHLKRSS